MSNKVLRNLRIIVRNAIGLGALIVGHWTHKMFGKFAKTDVPIIDDAEFEARYYRYKTIASENDIEHSTWSIHEVTDFSQVPFPKATKLVYDEHWGDSKVEIPLPANATWLDLWKAADKAILQSTDTHHSFIEHFVERRGILYLVTGS